MSYFVSERRDLLQLERVHAFLSLKAYWCLGIPFDTVERACANSLCFGAYRSRYDGVVESDADIATVSSADVEQVGFARVVTDSATFAWICDVYVDEAARGHGLSKALMREVMSHPQLQGLRRICLGTHDAHELYKQFGFYVTKSPGNWMEIKNDQIYLIGR